MTESQDPFAPLVGQPAAVERLRAATTDPVHAYLFVGPRGSGKRRAAFALAGEWVGDPTDRDRSRRLAAAGDHPDVVVVEPEGNTLRMDEARLVTTEASRAPVEGPVKVIVVDRFQDAEPEAAAALLKPIEEPPPSTRFILLAEYVPPEHVTIASRSTQIDFPPVSVAAIVEALIGSGVDADMAAAAAQGSGGDVERAELLVSDPAFAARRALWWEIPSRLDGSGHRVGELVAEVRAAVDQAQEPLENRHARDAESMDAVEELTGTRGSGRCLMEVKHRREARQHRTDELRMGLATLAQRYRSADLSSPDVLEVFPVLTDAAEALIRNPNEELWLTTLLLDLPTLGSTRI